MNVKIQNSVSPKLSIPISNPIPIPSNNNNVNYNSPKKEDQLQYSQNFEYNLNSNIFDPSKTPPVSEFMTKLNSRMKFYGWDWYNDDDNNTDNFENA
jgi:hypothetical protein